MAIDGDHLAGRDGTAFINVDAEHLTADARACQDDVAAFDTAENRFQVIDDNRCDNELRGALDTGHAQVK